jgi:hypothetical protein
LIMEGNFEPIISGLQKADIELKKANLSNSWTFPKL